MVSISLKTKRSFARSSMRPKSSPEVSDQPNNQPYPDTVLEIGPGKGALTLELVKYARKVIAIEFDPRQVVDLMKLIPHEYKSKIEVIHADFLSVDLHKYPFDLCVSNCPYNISSGICFKVSHPQQATPSRTA